MEGVEFLGFLFQRYGGQIRVSPKNIRKFEDRVRQITRRNRGVSMPRRYHELRRYFQGWVGYFGLVPIKSCFSELGKWVKPNWRNETRYRASTRRSEASKFPSRNAARILPCGATRRSA